MNLFPEKMCLVLTKYVDGHYNNYKQILTTIKMVIFFGNPLQGFYILPFTFLKVLYMVLYITLYIFKSALHDILGL